MTLQWMLIRGSGLLAFGLLAASVLWGLVLSLGILPRSVKNLTLVHESLSVGALVATLVHMVAIGFDEFVDFDAAAVLVPGRAPWKPLAVSWGIAAFYGMVVVILSFYIRKHIGQATWRSLHYLSFGVFLSALVHGLTAGTDTADPWVFFLYAGTGAAVLALVVLRIVTTPKEEPTPAARSRGGAPVVDPPGGEALPPRKPRIPVEVLAAARADGESSDSPAAEPAVPAAAPAVPATEPAVTAAAPAAPRIPEHLLERARKARESHGAPAEMAPTSTTVTVAVAAPPESDVPPVAVGDETAAPPPARKPRIPPEALAAAKAARAAREASG